MRMRMKKLLSILLVTAMLASMAVTAFADTPAANSDVAVMSVEARAAGDVTIAASGWDDNKTFTAGTEAVGGSFTLNVEAATSPENTVEEPGATATKVKLKATVAPKEGTEKAAGDCTITAKVGTNEGVDLSATASNDAYEIPADNGLTVEFTSVLFDDATTAGEYTITLEAVGEDGSKLTPAATATVDVTVNAKQENNGEVTLVGEVTLPENLKAGEKATGGSIVLKNTNKDTTNVTIKAEITPPLSAKAADIIKAKLDGGQEQDLLAGATFSIPVGNSNTITFSDVTLNTPGDYSIKFTITPVGSQAITKIVTATVTDPNTNPPVTTTVTAALGAFTLDESDTTGKTYTGELTLTRTGTESVNVTVTDVTLSEGTATITIDDAAAKGKKITVNQAEVKVPVKVVYADKPTAGDYEVTATLEGTTETTVKGALKVEGTQIPDETTVAAALSAFTLDENDAEGKTYTGELTLTRTGTDSVDVTVTDVTLSGGAATITIDDAAAKGKKITVNQAEVKVPVKVVYADKPTAGSYKVTATLEGATPTSVQGNLNVINPDEASAVLEVGEPNADGVVTGTLTLSNPTNAAITPTVKVEVEGQANITVTPTTGDWTNDATVEVIAGTVETPTQKVLGFTITFPENTGANDVNYTIKATVGDLAVIGDGSVTIPGTGSGENPGGGDEGNNDNNGSSNSGSSSSGSSNSTSANAPSANVGSNGAVSAAKISGDAKKAVSNAKNGKANVNVTNAKTVGTAALNNMAKAAAKEDVALTMTAKTTDKNGVVVASLKFDATKAAEAVAKAGTKEVKLGVELNTKNTKNVTSLFKKWFKNKNMATVKMAQKGEFGFTVEAAVKVDLKNFNKNNLKFYSYNAATNTYKEIETKYTIDSKGLVHFNTTVGNYVIITDAPIASK